MSVTVPSPLRTRSVEGDDADDDRAAYAARLIAARCPELTGAEIDRATANWRFTDADGGSTANWRSQADAVPAVIIAPELAQRLTDVLEAFAERMDRIEGWLRTEGAA
jgi:hypothetical protein